MHLSSSHTASNLPKKFPIGTTYVVEGRSGEAGELQVYSRYVVLPGGRRINVADDNLAKAERPRRRPARGRASSQSRRKTPAIDAKKIAAATGTPRQRRR